jgi:hypothetical protein
MGGDNKESSPWLILMLARFGLSRNRRQSETCTNFLGHPFQFPIAGAGKPSLSLSAVYRTAEEYGISLISLGRR